MGQPASRSLLQGQSKYTGAVSLNAHKKDSQMNEGDGETSCRG